MKFFYLIQKNLQLQTQQLQTLFKANGHKMITPGPKTKLFLENVFQSGAN